MVKRSLIQFHRWLGLCLSILWLAQALTGIILVFHWELDDWSIDGETTRLNPTPFDQRLESIKEDYPDAQVDSLWVSGGIEGRYDIYLDQPSSGPTVIRVDGEGNVLRTQSAGDRLAQGAFYTVIFKLHKALLGGRLGEWLIAISSIFLLITLILGLTISWPQQKNFKQDLLPSSRGPRFAHLRSWHKSLGLWFAFPAIILVLTGVILIFQKDIARALHITPLEPSSQPSVDSIKISPTTAIQVALSAAPEAKLSGLIMPTSTLPYYTVRLLDPSEWRRVKGKSTILISPTNGIILARQNATDVPLGQRILYAVYPLHTGEVLGNPGRILTLILGVWLAAMVILGYLTWKKRRQFQRRRTT